MEYISRRVIVLRRPIASKEDALEADQKQLPLPVFQSLAPAKDYEYAVLVTSLPYDVLAIAQLYRDRADCENCFDELKNQWGWGGYTTHDLKRCRVVSRLVALVYNWWTLFVRLAQPQKHSEAITSRPLLLHGVARQTKHAGQTTITITSHHAKTPGIQAAFYALAWFLDQLKKTAEQLPIASRMKIITRQAFRYFLDRISNTTPLIPAPA
jgi:hypothetical protein